MNETAEVQRVDLTAPSDGLTYVEVLTPAGIVRVNANLIDWRTKQPVVMVEIEHAPDWEPDERHVFGMNRVDVALAKRSEGGDSGA